MVKVEVSSTCARLLPKYEGAARTTSLGSLVNASTLAALAPSQSLSRHLQALLKVCLLNLVGI